MKSKRGYRIVPAGEPGRRNVAGPSPPADPAPAGYELVLDEFPPRRTNLIALRADDKEVFDTLQAWWRVEHGERLTQWGLFSLVLGAALSNPEGPFVGARLGKRG